MVNRGSQDVAVRCCTSCSLRRIIRALWAWCFALVSEWKPQQSCTAAVSTGNCAGLQGPRCSLLLRLHWWSINIWSAQFSAHLTGWCRRAPWRGCRCHAQMLHVTCYQVFPGRMDAWFSLGCSTKQELTVVVQGPCAVHGRAGKDISYFSPLIVSVNNLLLVNDMQQVNGFLEKVPPSLRGH